LESAVKEAEKEKLSDMTSKFTKNNTIQDKTKDTINVMCYVLYVNCLSLIIIFQKKSTHARSVVEKLKPIVMFNTSNTPPF